MPFHIMVLLLVSVGLLVLRAARASKLPPGPKGLPILGNILQIPSKLQFLKFTEWAKELGDIYTVNLAGKKLIVLSSAQSAADVLDRMSSVTTNRPRFVMNGEIMSKNFMLPAMPYGNTWRRVRRVMHEGFNIRACEAYYSFQESEAAYLVLSLLEDPSEMKKHLMNVAGNSTWRAVYSGPRLTAEEEKKTQKVHDIGEALLKAAAPLSYIVDTLPFLKVLPPWMASWRRFGDDFFRDTNSFFSNILREERHRQDAQGHLGFIALSAGSFTRFAVTEQEIAWTAGTLFTAGVETTAAALHQFVLAMVLYPDVMKRAQSDIDNVVGSRPPVLTDRDQLPYIQAMIKEVHRWRPVVPLAIPHAATESFQYRGFVIPKGANIISNIWAITHDPAVFPDHDVFRPERYLTTDGSLKDPLPNYHDDIVSYGYGRRICPGRDFANNSLFIDMTYLLWAFHFTTAKDEAGKPITPDAAAFHDSGLSVHPAPFRYELHPRRRDLKKLLESV